MITFPDRRLSAGTAECNADAETEADADGAIE